MSELEMFTNEELIQELLGRKTFIGAILRNKKISNKLVLSNSDYEFCMDKRIDFEDKHPAFAILQMARILASDILNKIGIKEDDEV